MTYRRPALFATWTEVRLSNGAFTGRSNPCTACPKASPRPLALLRAEGFQMELEDFLEALPGLLDEHHSNTLWRADIERRIKAHGYGRW